MATIGTFTASNNGFTGSVKTLTLNVKATFVATEKENDKAHHPIRDFEEWKNLAGNLHQQPRDNCVGDCHLVNIAPLQFCEKIRFVHDFVGLEGTRTLSFWHNAVKRGSLR